MKQADYPRSITFGRAFADFLLISAATSLVFNFVGSDPTAGINVQRFSAKWLVANFLAGALTYLLGFLPVFVAGLLIERRKIRESVGRVYRVAVICGVSVILLLTFGRWYAESHSRTSKQDYLGNALQNRDDESTIARTSNHQLSLAEAAGANDPGGKGLNGETLRERGKNSSFENVDRDGVQISLPRNWLAIGAQDADALNTNSESLGEKAGIAIGQGDNSILFARNALSDTGKTDATARVSIRSSGIGSQAEFRAGLASESPEAIRRELLNTGQQVANAMHRVPGIVSYTLVDAGIQRNSALTCMWSRYQADYGDGIKVIDGWVCPIGNRTLKLTTSFRKSKAALFEATTDHIWRSLAATG